ncbi:MAG TPA: MFS transporter [Chloroflexota bacterium]|jgi:SHS family lactate transporter-like MFS transporter|nr:MFS transporter [Chloroflexota bacterium]
MTGHAAALPAGLTGWQRRIFAANFLGLTFEAYDLTIYSLLVVPIAEHFQVPTWYSFVVLGMTYVARGLGGLLFGHIGDKIGRRNALIFTVLGYSITTALTGLSWSVGALLLWRGLTGLFIGGEYVAYSYTMEAVPKEQRGVYSGLLVGSYSIGFLLASASFAIVSALTGAQFVGDGWRWPFFVGILPALIALWLRLGVEESPAWLQLVQAGRPRPRIPLFEVFKRPYLGRTLHAWILMAALIWAYDVLILAFPTMLSLLNFPRESIGTLSIILNLGSLLGSIAGGAVSQRIGRRRALIGTAVLGGVTAPLLAPFWMLPAIPSYGYFAIAGFIGAIFAEAGFGMMPAYLSERYPTAVRATGATGTYNLGQIIAGWSTAILARQFGGSASRFTQGMVIHSVIAFVVLIVLALLGPETRDVDLSTA